jgi:hypothetical protein
MVKLVGGNGAKQAQAPELQVRPLAQLEVVVHV